MSGPATRHVVNPKTGMTHAEMKQFIRDHFEDFVNRQRLHVADVNFAPEFVDHGEGAYKRVPYIHVTIENMIAEDDKVVVRNRWTGTEAASGQRVLPRAVGDRRQVDTCHHPLPVGRRVTFR